jgi:hypothetical protein
MFSYDGNKRPTIAELKAHPWVNKPFSVKMTRSTIMEKLNDKRSEKTAHMSKEDDKNYRGGDMKELIRQPSESQLELYKFNDLVDHDVEVMPGTIWEELNMFNEDLFEGKLKLDYNSDKQYMTIEMSDPETGALDFLVKAKFFALNNTEEDEPMRLRLRLTKKRGDLQKWYDVLNEMKETGFDEILLAPLSHQEDRLEIHDNDDSTKSE